MRDFHIMVRRMLRDHDRRKRYLAFLLALSMLVTLAVPLSTMKPAISTVKKIGTPLVMSSAAVNSGSGWEGEYSEDGAPETAPAGAIDFKDKLTKVSITPVNIEGGDGVTAHGSFKLEYQFEQGSGVGEGMAEYIYYQIPENITADVDIYGSDFRTVDRSGEYAEWYLSKFGVSLPSAIVGYYTINKDNGMMIIKFTEDYLKYISDQHGAFTGLINFDGNVTRAQTESGDQHIVFGGDAIPLDVSFNDKELGLSKDARLVSETSEFPKVEWTVTISNQDGFFDLSSFVLSDAELSRAESVQIEPAYAAAYSSGSNTVDLTGGTDSNGNYPTTITIKYVTSSTEEDMVNKLDTNEAKLIDYNNNVRTKTAEAEVPLTADKASVAKTAAASYEIDGNVGNDGYIQWEMTVTRPYGQSLENYVVADDMWSSTSQLTFDPAGAGTLNADGTVTLNTSASKVKITYKTDRPAGGEGSVTNNASVTPPGGTEPDGTDSVTKNYSEQSLVNVDKQGSFLSETNSIQWTVTVSASGENAKSLKEYVINDPQLTADGAGDTSATDITVVSASNNGQAVSGVTVTKDNDTLSINSSEDIDYIQIKYTKKLNETQLAAAKSGETTVTNDVEVKDPDEPEVTYPKTGSARVPQISDSVSKSVVGDKYISEEGYYSEEDKPAEKTIDITWKVSIDNYGSIASDPYVDTLDQNFGENYLSQAITTINASETKGQSGTALSAGTDFTVKYFDKDNNQLSGFEAGKVTKFEITFINADSYKDLSYYDFTYTSSANVLDVANNGTAYFKNTGEKGPGVTGEDTLTYHLENPRTISLNTSKIWYGDIESMHADKSVTVTLQQKLGENGTWHDYTYPAGSTKQSTVQLTSAVNWQYAWGDLPQHAADADKTPYYYRVVETGAVEGYDTQYSFDTGAGVNSDGWLNVTNTYEKICITAVKSWSDGLNEPVSVTLQRKPDGADDSQWADIAAAATQTLDTSNSFTYSWTDLDTGYDYRVVENDVKSGYRVKYSASSVDTTSTITVTNEPDVLKITSRKIWSGDTGYESSRPDSVTLVLQRSEEFVSGGWTSQIPDVETEKTITSANWNELAEWADLPAHNYVSGNAYYYRVVEKNTYDGGKIEGYTSSYDTEGSNTDAELDVTNVFDSLILTGHKQWQGDSYIKGDRPDSITLKLQRKTDQQTGWSDVSGTAVTVTKNSDDTFDDVSWPPQPKRDAGGNTYTYRIAEDPVPEGYESESTETRTSGRITVTNTSTKIKITVNKVWLNDANAVSERPNITVALERKTGDSGSWEQIKTQTLYTNGYTVTPVTWSGIPTMSSDGEPYYYRVVEVTVPEGYKESYALKISDSEKEEINLDNGAYLRTDSTFEITNDYTLSYTKNAVDESGRTYTQASIKSLDTKMVDVTGSGVNQEVYVFKYRITATQAAVFEDTIQSNSFKLLVNDAYPITHTDSYGNTYSFNKTDEDTLRNNDNWYYYYDSISNTILFKTQGSTTIEYYTYILAEDMPEITSSGYTFTNNLIAEEEGSEVVKCSVKITDEKDYLTKSVALPDTNLPATDFSYTLDVNPEARYITNDGSVVITDVFNILGAGYEGNITYGKKLVDTAIENLTVYDVDAGRILDKSEYSYTIDYGSSVAQKVDIRSDLGEMVTSKDGYYLIQGDFKKGTVVTIKYTEVGSSWGGSFGTLVFLNTLSDYGSDLESLDDYSIAANEEIEVTKTYVFDQDRTGYFGIRSTYFEDVDFVSVVEERFSDDADGVFSITVPDGKHLRITYDYALYANERTPIKYRNESGQGVSYRIADPYGDKTLEKGDELPSGSAVVATNSATLQSNKGEETSDVGKTQLVAQTTLAENQSGGTPKIEKVNIGNYAISTLKATFKVAKYDRENGWIYASSFTQPTASEPGEFTFDPTLKEVNGYMPEGAASIEIDGQTKAALQNSSLYKFVEIVAPEGYKPTGWTDEHPLSLEELEDFTFYYVNNVTAYTAMPDDFDADNATYVSGGRALDIPNIEMIDITVTKNWEDTSELNGQTATSKVQLLWSDKKSSTIPANAKPVEIEDLDVEDPDFINSFVNVKTLSTAQGQDTTVWSGLPNGVKGKPIYYYVREISYTIGSTEFKLRDDGSFTTDPDSQGNVIVGTYRPLYVGNGANRSGSDVDITNAKSLVIKKLWKDTVNRDVDGSEVEFKEVGFKLYGIDVQGRRTDDPIYSGKLTRDNGWTFDLEGVDLGDYTDFEVVEVVDDPSFGLDLTKAQTRTLRKMYSVSYTKNLNGDIGELTIINKDSTPKKVPYEVKKVWQDGLSSHDGITVHLYKTELDLSEYPGWDGSVDPGFVDTVNADKGAGTIIEIGAETLDDSNGWEYIWQNMDYIIDATTGSHYFYYVYEEPIDAEKYPDYTTEYDYEGDKDGIYAKIINSQSDKITIKKVWENTDNYEQPDFVELELYRTLYPNGLDLNGLPSDLDADGKIGTADYSTYQYLQNIKLRKSDDWTLELANFQTVNGSSVPWYYFVREVDTNRMYTISYSNNGITLDSNDTITVTNTVKSTDLSLIKKWSDGEEHLSDPVTIRIYRTKSAADNADQLAAFETDPEILVVKPNAVGAVTTNSTNITAEIADSTLASVTANADGSITVNALDKTGETTISVRDGNTLTTKTVTLIVSKKPVPVLSIDKTEMNAGENAQLTVNMVGGAAVGETTYNVTVLSGSPNVTVENGVVSASNMGVVEITATVNGVTSKPVTLEIGLADFTVEPTMEVSLEQGGQITPDPSYGTFRYASNDVTKVSVNETTGEVTGVAYTNENSPVAVTVTRLEDGVSKTVLVTVKDLPKSYELSNGESITLEPGDKITNIKVTGTEGTGNIVGFRIRYNYGEVFFGQADNYSGSAWGVNAYTTSRENTTATANTYGVFNVAFDDVYVVPSDGTSDIQMILSGFTKGTIEITYEKETANTLSSAPRLMSLSSVSKKTYLAAADAIQVARTFESDGYIEVTFTPSQGDTWKKLIEDLPACDTSGNPYYYYAVEDEMAHYKASYKYEDDDDQTELTVNALSAYVNSTTPKITVVNSKEETGVKMPTTGGEGTRRLYAVGMFLIGASALGYVAKRRRRTVK